MMTMSNLIMTLMQPAFAAWLLKATALLMLALAVTAVLRRAAAGTRHLVWLGTLAGILLLPAVSAWAPLRLAIVPAELMPSFAAARDGTERVANDTRWRPHPSGCTSNGSDVHAHDVRCANGGESLRRVA